MDRDELIETVNDMLDEGCGIIEVFEFIEDNSDLDPSEIIMAVM